jgi:hypothetical protein
MQDQPSFEPTSLVSGVKPGWVFAGVAIDWTLSFVFGLVMFSLFVGAEAWGLDNGAIDELIDKVLLDPNFLITSLLVGSFATIIGAYVAARRANVVPLKHGFWVAVASTVIYFAISGDKPSSEYPLWYEVVAWVLVLPCGLVGGYLAKLRQISKSA